MPNHEKREVVRILNDGLTVVKKSQANRNDKCPCGSNKKLKHCCLNKIENGYKKLIRTKKQDNDKKLQPVPEGNSE